MADISERQKVARHYTWTLRSLDAAIALSSWMMRKEGERYLSENTVLSWIRLTDQLKLFRKQLKQDFDSYHERVASASSK